jgi:hypothetical protein
MHEFIAHTHTSMLDVKIVGYVTNMHELSTVHDMLSENLNIILHVKIAN